MSNLIHLVECPRDAMQGWRSFIPTNQKIAYINSLLKVGFDTIDFGSFVSLKAIPQMADTADVLKQLRIHESKSKLLAIVANVRGAEEAVKFDEITFLGFPFSISPTFQLRNTNSTIEESLVTVESINELCIKNNKQAVIYLSMGFGNPYGDEYNEEIVLRWADKLVDVGIKIISVADTVGVALPSQVTSVLNHLVPTYPGVEIGVHLHSSPLNWKAKAEAALMAGCKRFDGAINGIGGCPMADDELVGNMDTLKMIDLFKEQNILPEIDEEALLESVKIANGIFL